MDIRNPLIHHRIGHPDWFVEKESQYERCSKPRLVDDYRGLYYINLYYTNQYNGTCHIPAEDSNMFTLVTPAKAVRNMLAWLS